MQENICDKIENDDFYQNFLKDNKNDKLAETLTITDQIKKLSEGLDVLSLELQSQVREQHGALLSQASHAGRLDAGLNTINTHMSRIQSGANKIRSHLNEQFTLVENQTKILGRLHEASHILRSCGNMLHLTNKLRNSKDLYKQALLLFELEPLAENDDISKIDFMQEERAFVLSSRQRLNSLAQLDLINGLKDRKENQVIKSLQIFMNLQTIEKCLENLVTTFINEITHSIKECFAGTDVAALSSQKPQSIDNSKDANNRPSGGMKGPGKTPNLTTSQHFRAKLWKSLHWLIYDELYEYCEQIFLLRKCLENTTQSNYLNQIKPEHIQREFWDRVENLFKKSFTECSPHIAQCLQEGLPKLLAAARGLQVKISGKFTFSDKIFESLEAGYLTKCGGNLKACLAGVDSPGTDAIDNLIRTSTSELSSAMVDNRLSTLVAAVLNACNKDFWTKIEAQVKLGTDSKQVVDVPNLPQIQNTNLANIVFYHSEAVKRMVTNLGEHFAKSSAAESILENLSHGETLILAVLQQLIDSMTTTVGIILLSMHREPGLNTDKLSVTGPSLYMKELQDFLQRCWNYHILPFDDKITTQKCGEQLACRCIDLFVNNLAILRPLSNAGRNRLKNDCNHLETALKPIIPNLSSLGKPFRLLRAMSSLITQSPETLIQQEIEKESPVPCYIILLMLFSHAGSDFQSPHVAANWSNERFIQWLDGHTSDKERLELVAGALQRYRDSIRRKNSTQYDPIYPFLSTYFEKAFKAIL